jgi:hypothetical protein
MTSPLAIYQRALDAVSASVLSGDFAAYLAMLDLPYLVRLSDADIVLTRSEELEPTFRALSQGLARRGVTHYERVAREAQFQRMDRIVGRHFTHMIAGGDRIAAPHASAAALVRREGGVWRFTEASYPFLRADWPLTEAMIFGASPVSGPSTGARP